MKQAELRNHTTCSSCQEPILNAGLPLFWTFTANRYGVDLGAVRRANALGDFMGSHGLAAIMGPDETLAKPMMEPAIITICENCILKPIILASLVLDTKEKDRG